MRAVLCVLKGKVGTSPEAPKHRAMRAVLCILNGKAGTSPEALKHWPMRDVSWMKSQCAAQLGVVGENRNLASVLNKKEISQNLTEGKATLSLPYLYYLYGKKRKIAY